VLVVQGNVTLCEVIFVSETKLPAKDRDSYAVQTGVSLHTLYADCGPMRSIIQFEVIEKFCPVAFCSISLRSKPEVSQREITGSYQKL
jgi:hypothetical protein